MEKKTIHYKLELTPEIVRKLELADKIEAEWNTDGLFIKKRTAKQRSMLPNWVLAVFSLGAVLIFLALTVLLKVKQVPLSGDFSISGFLLVGGGFLATGFFTINFIFNRRAFLAGLKNRIFWRMLPVVVLAFTTILFVVLLGFAWLLGQLFKGVSFDQLTSALLVGIMIYTVTLLWSQLAEQIRATWLTTVFTVIMMTGVLLSMATNSSRQWWQINLSFLGTKAAENGWQFNMTLILSALVLVSLVDYLFVALGHHYGKDWKMTVLRLLLTFLALDLGAVGYFPNDGEWHHLHTQFAGYLIYIVILLIVSVPWLVPQVTKDFITTSYLIGAVLVALEIAFQFIGYLSLTAFEMSAFLLAFNWLLLLFSHLEKLILPERQKLQLKLTAE
ncbi:permease [Streptococcus chenjunshii]|uniref:Permease n=1 Tax=Streptococcus chenjunshii TaxID=2173853 RepID=A0A372KN93_9STRE|nr:permease [Streptococcus chenjunshii]AXQ78190.1 permease [Streptococcus chenjunshii]RFU50939.1 permease [Streptococcus chenjunshii]RFU53436.1 permease [Streptococcus chenjunshii]